MADAFPAVGGAEFAHTGSSLVIPAKARRSTGVRKHKLKRKKRKAVRAYVPPSPPANVTLRAAMAPGGVPVTGAVGWRVTELGEAPEVNRLIWSGGGAEVKVRLDPGRYRIDTEYGLVKKTTTITVPEDKPLNSTVVLNAGTLRVHSAAVAGGPPLSDVFFVLRGTDGVHTADLARSAVPTAEFRVPAGIYRILVQHGLARTMIMANVEPGREVNAEAVMNTGVLSLAARATSDGPPMSGAAFSVYEDGDDPARREIVRSVRDEPHFDLPAGTYRVAASLGLAREERKVTVVAGKEQTEQFILNAGGVRLSSTHSGNRQPVDKSLLYKVFAMAPTNGPAGQAVHTTASVSPTIFLREGKYRIESQYGWHNARQVREVDVPAGKTVDVNFVHSACNVNLKLVPKAGAIPMTQVKWTLKYTGGGTVLISQDATPALILQAGSYQATAQHNSKTFSRTFEAVSNADQTIELIAE